MLKGSCLIFMIVAVAVYSPFVWAQGPYFPAEDLVVKTVDADVEVKSKVFIDRDNPSYKADPASASIFNEFTANEITSTGGITLGGVTKSAWPSGGVVKHESKSTTTLLIGDNSTYKQQMTFDNTYSQVPAIIISKVYERTYVLPGYASYEMYTANHTTTGFLLVVKNLGNQPLEMKVRWWAIGN